MQKVAVIGLDSVPPEMMFQKLLDKLPNIKKMYEAGLRGNLRSCDPPITIPAWMVMMTGKSPGKLGIYGFRHRWGFSYKDGYIVNSTNVKEDTVWNYLSDKGKHSIVLGVPPGYPPKQIDNAQIVSGIVTPSHDKEFTSPKELKQEILSAVGGKYPFDVTLRTEDRDKLKNDLFELMHKKFDVAEYLAKNKPWDFFIMHEIGFDRLHHAFWKFFDPTHPKYVKGNPYENLDLEYYRAVDERLGRLVGIFGNNCTTFVLSDHGSKRMLGAFCVNQWLEKEGYLVFKKRPTSITDIDKAEINWSKTKAWGWGGYYARIFFNVKGREENGIIEREDLENEIAKLSEKIMNIEDHTGRRMKNSVLRPDELFGTAVGDKPDLMVYFDDMDWRSAGTVGHDSMYLFENDTGPDDSVHSMDGVFLMYDPKRKFNSQEIKNAKIEDIAPTLLKMFDIAPGEGMDGRVLSEVFQNGSAVLLESSIRKKGNSNNATTRPEGFTIWMTGLPGAGKSTLAKLLKTKFENDHNRFVEVLDGDEVRKGLSKDLGLSKEDREEHARRVSYLAKVLSRNGVISIVALISPYKISRDGARELIGNRFLEVYIRASLATCEKRDPKGLYAKARKGEISNMTGIQDPYEVPGSPDIIVDTEGTTPDESADQLISNLQSLGFL